MPNPTWNSILRLERNAVLKNCCWESLQCSSFQDLSVHQFSYQSSSPRGILLKVSKRNGVFRYACSREPSSGFPTWISIIYCVEINITVKFPLYNHHHSPTPHHHHHNHPNPSSRSTSTSSRRTRGSRPRSPSATARLGVRDTSIGRKILT